MKGRTQTVTRHGSPNWDEWREKTSEECLECGSSKTDLQMGSVAERRAYSCRECGCEWFSTPQPSARCEPIIIEGREDP